MQTLAKSAGGSLMHGRIGAAPRHATYSARVLRRAGPESLPVNATSAPEPLTSSTEDRVLSPPQDLPAASDLPEAVSRDTASAEATSAGASLAAASDSSSNMDAFPEEVFYEGSGSDTELLVSSLLGLSLIYAPLTLSSIGRRLWFKLKISNKRIVVTFNSPITKNEIQVTYDKVKEVRTVNRAFGAWGDMVIFLKNGKNIELIGMDRTEEIKEYIEQRIGPFY